MKVRLVLFAMARDVCGKETIEIELADDGTVGNLRKVLRAEIPGLSTLLANSLFAVGTEYVPDDFTLKEGAEVACIPPVSGG